MALAQLADLDWAAGNLRACLGWCERLLEVEPLEETVHVRMLECLERLGEPLAAVLHFRRATRMLAEQQLPVPPRLTAIARRIEAAFGGAPA